MAVYFYVLTLLLGEKIDGLAYICRQKLASNGTLPVGLELFN